MPVSWAVLLLVISLFLTDIHSDLSRVTAIYRAEIKRRMRDGG